MADRFEGIIAQLKEEKSRLSDRKEQLTAELRAIDADIKSVQSALAALGAKPTPQKPGGRTIGATHEQSASLVAEVLRDLGTLDLDALHSQVRARMRSQRLSCVGFDARFKEVLAEERFNESPAGWKLVVADELTETEDAPEEVHR